MTGVRKLIQGVWQHARGWCLKLAQALWQDLSTIARALAHWHRERMASEPAYAVALAAGSEALVRLFVPSRVLTNVLLRLIRELSDLTSAPTGSTGRSQAYAGSRGWNDPWGDD